MDEKMDKKYRRSIAASYLFRFRSSFDLGDGIWVLYLLRKGLTLWQVGLLEGVFHIAGLVSEVPSGAMADLFGRKSAMLISRVLAAVSTLVTIYAGSMLPLAVAFVLNAWSYNLLSGSDEALLYDSFLRLGRERQYFHAAGRMGLAAEIAQAAGVLVGGILVKRSYALCYLFSAGIQTATFFAGVFLTEPRTAAAGGRVTVRAHFAASFALLKDRPLRRMLLRYAVLFASHTTAFFYAQQLYHDRGFDTLGVSMILLGMGIAASAGALLSQYAARRLGKYTAHAEGSALAVGLALMAAGPISVSLGGFALACFANALLGPLHSAALNRRIPSDRRATLISVSSMCFSACMIVLFPLAGALAVRLGLRRVVFLLGALLFAYIPLTPRLETDDDAL